MQLLTRKLTHLNFPAISNAMGLTLSVNKAMKNAKVIPLTKSGNKSHFSNYRPISLLSQFSKILEKLFNLRLEQFLISNEILSNCQYGFRSRMSTGRQLWNS